MLFINIIFQASTAPHVTLIGEPANVLDDNIVADISRKKISPAVALPGQSLMEPTSESNSQTVRKYCNGC